MSSQKIISCIAFLFCAQLFAANSAPVLDPIGEQDVDEGDTLTFTATATDAEGDPLEFSLDVGAPPAATITPQGVFSFLAADGPATIVVTIRVKETSGEQLSDFETFTISVANLAPEIELNGEAETLAGYAYRLTIGAPTDAGTDTVFSGQIHWGDGFAINYVGAGEYVHIYASANVGGTPRTIAIDLVDEDGKTTDVATLDITVYPDSGPRTVLTGNASVNEGASFELTVGAPTGTESGSITGGTIHWCDGATSPYTAPGVYAHTYQDNFPGGRTADITIDFDTPSKTYFGAGYKGVFVRDANPSAILSGDLFVNIGVTYELTIFPPTDPGNDTISGGTLYWGDETSTPYTGPGQYTHAYQTNLPFRIDLDVFDEDGLHEGVGQFLVQVNSVPVFTSALIAQPTNAVVGEAVFFTASVSDADSDALNYDWDFGDGTSGSTFRAGKIYMNPGTYTITVVVTDGYGGTITDSMQYTVGILPLNVGKMSVKLNFAKAGNDGIQAKGILPIELFGSPNDFFYLIEGETVSFNIGGVTRQFVLDGKGKSKLVKDTLAIGKPKNNTVTYTMKIQKGNFAEALADDGFVNEDRKSVPITVNVRIFWLNLGYEKLQPQVYSAKKGKSGSSK